MLVNYFRSIYHGKSEKNKKPLLCFMIQPSGNLFLTSGKDKVVKLWNLTKSTFNPYLKNFRKEKTNKNFYWRISFNGIISENSCSTTIIKWSSDGKRFATGGSDGSICIFENIKNPIDVKYWRISIILKENSSEIVDISWPIKSNKVLSSSLDGTIVLWDFDIRKIILKVSIKIFGKISIAWDPTDSLFAGNLSNKKLFIWNLRNPYSYKMVNLKPKKTPKLNNSSRNFLPKLFWTPCGNYIIATTAKRPFLILHIKFNIAPILGGKNGILKHNDCKTLSLNNRWFKIIPFHYMTLLVSITTIWGEIIFWNFGILRPLLSIKCSVLKDIQGKQWFSNGNALFLVKNYGESLIFRFTELEIKKFLSWNLSAHFFRTVYFISSKNFEDIDRKYHEIFTSLNNTGFYLWISKAKTFYNKVARSEWGGKNVSANIFFLNNPSINRRKVLERKNFLLAYQKNKIFHSGNFYLTIQNNFLLSKNKIYSVRKPDFFHEKISMIEKTTKKINFLGYFIKKNCAFAFTTSKGEFFVKEFYCHKFIAKKSLGLIKISEFKILNGFYIFKDCLMENFFFLPMKNP